MVNDVDKTKEQLIQELTDLRRRLAAWIAPQEGQSSLGRSNHGKQASFDQNSGAIGLVGGGSTLLSLTPLTIGDRPGWQATVADLSVRKRREEQLHLLNSALVATANGIVITDLSGTITWVNPAFTRLTGYTAAEAIGANPRLLKSGGQDPVFYASLWDTILSGQVWHGELTNRRKDGSHYIEEQTITPVFDERGEIGHFIAIKQDISARKRADEALRASEERYRTLAEAAQDVIFIIDRDDRVTYVNTFAAKLFAKRPAELLNRPRSALFPPDESGRQLDRLRLVFETGQPLIVETKLALPGHDRWLEVRLVPLYDASGRVESVLGAGRDVTNRKQTEEKFRQLEDLYRRAITAAGSVAYQKDNVHQVYSFIGEGIQPLTGYSTEEMTPDLWDSLCLEDVFLGPLADLSSEEAMRRVREGEAHEWTTDTLIRTRQGEERWISDTSVELRDELGKSIGSIGLLQDLTERKRAEEAIRLHAARATALARTAQRLNAQLSVTATLNVICEETAQALNVPAVSLTLYDAAHNQFYHAVDVGLPSEYRAHALAVGAMHGFALGAAEGNLIIRPDVQTAVGEADTALYQVCDMRTMVSIRLAYASQLVGWLNIYTFGASREFSAEELELLQGLAYQAAQAIANARLFDAAQRRLQRLTALHMIDKAILQVQELSATLGVIVEQVVARSEVDAVSVLLFNRDSQVLEYAAGAGFYHDGIKQSRVRLGEGHAGRAALERRIHFELSLDNSDGFTRRDLLVGEGFVSYCSVPLVVQGEIKGVLDVFHRSALVAEPEWLAFLEALALQTAIAIDHASLFTATRRLYQKTQEQAKQLEQVMETVPEGVLLLNREHQIVLARSCSARLSYRSGR